MQDRARDGKRNSGLLAKKIRKKNQVGQGWS